MVLCKLRPDFHQSIGVSLLVLWVEFSKRAIPVRKQHSTVDNRIKVALVSEEYE
jgi:hypothetical protein